MQDMRLARAAALALEGKRRGATGMQATYRGFTMRKTLRHTVRTGQSVSHSLSQ
jgi:hypothetical protein